MHTQIFDNIEMLIKMSNSTNNIDDISTELITLKKQITNKKNEIEDLKSQIIDARYFNASDELVDKNIEISLKNRIKRLNKKIKTIKKTIEEIKSSEHSLHTNIADLKSKLQKNEDYVKTLTKKTKDTSSNNYYKNLLEKETANIKLLNKELTNKNKQYQDLLKELELNNQAYSELNEELTRENDRLADVQDSLRNPNSYIDEELKQADKDKLNALNEELAALEKRKIEILTDATMIAEDAKELIAKNDIQQALNKIKELVTIVKSKPYMDITSLSVIDEELEKKENERTQLSNLIDNKNYDSLNSEAITKRISYLDEEIASNNKNIENYQLEINLIDNFINNTLGATITDLESEIANCEEILNEYQNMIKDQNKSLKTKANLENAISKKTKEKKVLDQLLVSYKENLIAKIKQTNTLNQMIINLESEITNYNQELDDLQKLTLLDFKTKDLIEEQSDKEKLKTLNEEIKQLKNRKKYDKTPDEIYDQIEMTLASLKTTPSLRTEKNRQRNLEIDSLFDTSTVNKTSNERLKVIQMIPVETIKKSVETIDDLGGDV